MFRDMMKEMMLGKVVHSVRRGVPQTYDGYQIVPRKYLSLFIDAESDADMEYMRRVGRDEVSICRNGLLLAWFPVSLLTADKLRSVLHHVGWRG